MSFSSHNIEYYKASGRYYHNAVKVLEFRENNGVQYGIEEILYLNPLDSSYYYIYFINEFKNSISSFKYCAKIDDKIYSNLEKLAFLKNTCYIDSLSCLPENIRRFITGSLKSHLSYSNIPYADVELYNGCICINTSIKKNDFNYNEFCDLVYNKNCLALLQTIEDIKKGYCQLNKEQFSKLKYRPAEEIRKENKELPEWVSQALKFGLKLGVRAGFAIIGGIIGANIFNNGDFDGDFDFDFDGDCDFSGGLDIDTSTFDFDSSNISFMGAPNDGSYLSSGQSVDIRSDSGVLYDNIKVFYHNGQKYLDFKNQWIKLPGSGFFHLLGSNYKIL